MTNNLGSIDQLRQEVARKIRSHPGMDWSPALVALISMALDLELRSDVVRHNPEVVGRPRLRVVR